MNENTIKQVQSLAVQAAAIAMLEDADLKAQTALVHKDFSIENLERFQEHRNRFTGKFSTSSLGEFVSYLEHYSNERDLFIFVSDSSLSATGFLDMGSLSLPGHCEHLCYFSAPYSAAWLAMENLGLPMTQKQAAEWLEDWAAHIEVFDEEGETIPLPEAVQALRKMTIEQSRKVESNQGTFRGERSEFESVEAKAEVMPAFFTFSARPHRDLVVRNVRFRISVLTSEENPKYVFRSIQDDSLKEDIQLEFQDTVSSTLSDRIEPDDFNVFLGTFK